MPRLVGLTGGIATGKSFVESILVELGAAVVDADTVARDVVKVGTDGLLKIRKRFGEEILLPDGTLDRAKLSDIVFTDESARHDLNEILHPLIAQESQRRIAELYGQGHKLVIYSAALLVEKKLYGTMQGLIVVHVSPLVQLERLQRRDSISEEAAQKRVAAQLPQREKLDVATHTIDNSGTKSETRALVANLWRDLNRPENEQS